MGIELQHTMQRSQNLAGSALPAPPPVSLRTAENHPERSETGVWIGIFAIVMSFAALTSAMIVRQGVSPDWRHFQLPKFLYWNTGILLVSSWTLEMGRSRLSRIARSSESSQYTAKTPFDGMVWLLLTLLLGGVFLLGQVLAWRVLAAQGLYLATNPSSSFFYVFTAAHGLHLLGGIVGLGYLILKLAKPNRVARVTGIPAVCMYWHFMDLLWVYLFVVLIART